MLSLAELALVVVSIAAGCAHTGYHLCPAILYFLLYPDDKFEADESILRQQIV